MDTQALGLTKRIAFTGALCALAASAFIVGAPTSAQAQSFSCEMPVTAPKSVRAAFDEYYACSEAVLDEWLSMYPAEVAQLQNLYVAWQGARGHDLRDQQAAGRWVRQHPVNFADRHVELSAAQVEENAPLQSAEPVRVSGAFERLFVDRDHRRLFLTSAEEGLVSVSIAKRYAFNFEGKVGQSGARDFFIYDDKTALVEERNTKGGNRDLVVLDISDRSNPREVARLRGALPEVGSATYFNPQMLEAPPTFDQYQMIREGRMGSSCGMPPTFSTHQGIHCRPDGACFKNEYRTNSDEGICTVNVVTPPELAVRRRLGMPGGRGEVSFDFDDGPLGGGATSPRPTRSAPMARAEESAAPRPMPSAPSAAPPSAGPVPQGGAGGAGSLSQMMVHGKTLYVLSAAQGINKGWLTSFDLTRPAQPRVRHVIALDNGPEALQRHDNLLLIAGRDAVVTASLGVESRPRLLGEFRQDCPVNYDPIVVQGTIGYRTIIVEGRRINCTSRLEVIDLSQPHQPVLRTTYPITRPRGLAVLGERLFVADEYQGVITFDIADPVNPAPVGTWPMQGVKDLVLSDFDLYAMTGGEIQTFYVGPLYEREVRAQEGWKKIEGHSTVISAPKKQAAEPRSWRRIWQEMW
jgi:hypothetical protein